MIVQKFGGTSMGTAESIREKVATLVKKAVVEKREPVVVVSAMTGVTNMLLQAASTAVEERTVNVELIEGLRRKHLNVLSGLEGDSLEIKETTDYINRELDELTNFLKAITVISELSQRSHDAIIALGEKLSARLLTCVLNCQGYPAEFVNLDKVVPLSLPYESDIYWDQIEDLFKERILKVRPRTIPVLTGFFGQLSRGMLEAVGRGYSDYCASLVGAAMRAEEIQIWTDVDGVLSANPRIVPEAFILERISFDEMAELSHFGAKVLHPYSVRPAVNSCIPIRILNTFNASCAGTLVEADTTHLRLPFKSVTCKRGITIIRITTPLMLLAYGYMAKISRVFAKYKVCMDLVATSEVSISMSVDEQLPPDSPFLAELSQHGEVNLQSNQSVLSLVGSEMQQDCSILGRVFGALESAHICVNMASLGNALINLTLVVNDADSERAVQLLHREFFKKD